MFYQPDKRDHGLSLDPFKSCVVPRPIGWISTRSIDGVVNLAPYSFYNAVSASPPMLMFSSNGVGPSGAMKDSRSNCEETGEFVVNMATWALREQVNATSFSYASEVDEMARAGLTAADCRIVKAPRVLESPIALECKYWQTIVLPSADGSESNAVVMGQVVGVHIDDRVLREGKIDIEKIRPLARMGYMDYCSVDAVFSMPRPTKT